MADDFATVDGPVVDGADLDADEQRLLESSRRACEDDREERVHTLFVVFEGRYVDGYIAVQPGELNGAAWFRELPANLYPFTEPLAETWEGGRAGGA